MSIEAMSVIVARRTDAVIFSIGQLPDGEETLFEIGSLTKIVTALTLANAVQCDTVKLEAPLGAFLPQLSERPTAKIRLIELATHTSGLPRVPPAIKKQAHPEDPYARYREADLMEDLHNIVTLPHCGAYTYSNFGYGALGLCLGAAYGRPFSELVAQWLLEPLNLRNARFSFPGSPSLSLSGHNIRGPAGDWHHMAMVPSGGLVASPRDFAKFLLAMTSPDSILSDPLGLTLAPRVRINGRERAGLGWLSDGELAWQSGGTGGFSAALILKGDSSACVLANRYPCPSLVSFAAKILSEAALGL